tara:strand:+ start:449 stop:1606 length:1158 start_codon:yes stop_codon:yes gene_type:complete
MKNFVKGLVAVSLFALPTGKAEAICLDYWLKGPAACQEQEDEKNRILISGDDFAGAVVKDQARLDYEKDLNVKIDKFLAGYGKPPREFAAFHLDPTLENAVRWVKKFNEEHERTMKIAVAWKQADQLFRQYKATGEILLPAESGVTPAQIKYLKEAFEGDATDLPKVKGFGVDLPGDWDEDRLARNYAKLDYKEKTQKMLNSERANPKPVSLYNLPDLEKQIERTSIMSPELKESFDAAQSIVAKAEKERQEQIKPLKAKEYSKPAKKETPKTKEKLEISYYFSAKCPYCTQFKPELKDAIAKYGKENVSLTCVDMTPGERKPSNVKGKLDCKWRPVLTGELKQFGISKTPSLIVKRGASNQLELLENYHESKTLVDYFTNGPKM